MRTIAALSLALGACACASAPPAPAPPPGPTYEQKMAWILRLEDSRTLRDPAPTPAPALVVPVERRRGDRTPVPPPPPPPDLTRLLSDPEPRVRHRAALAIGRVGLREGQTALLPLLADAEAEVRQMAAFGLGLIGDRAAREPLVALLADASPLVQGSAAEALGLIGDVAAAEPLARLAAAIVQSGALAQPPEGDEAARRDTAAGAFRQALNALVRLRAYGPLAAAVLDPSGRPLVSWWPVAYALQRLEEPRAVPALIALTRDGSPVTRAFAARGLGPLKDRTAVAALLPLVTGADRAPAIQAIRSLGQLGDRAAAPVLLKIVMTPKVDPHLRLEAVAALGGVGGDGVSETLQDLLGDSRPAVRSAAIRALAQIDAESFMFVLSGLDPDSHWSVRATLASVLGTLPPENALPRLRTLLDDTDLRVVPAVLAALASLGAPDAGAVALARLKAEDPIVRAAAATALGRLKPAGGADALAAAYRSGQGDASYTARGAALAALASYGAAARPVLEEALADKDWAMRVRAAALLKELDPSIDVDARIRPAPPRAPADFFTADRLVNPPVSTQAFIDTDRGTIQLELAVIDAPLTVENFVTLARKGFFDGLTFHRVVPDFVIQGGDPRADSEGGPGYTIRDELNQRPYLRGTLGMALDWEDTGGSQFFITHSPQPHLDARYTVFGRVIDGMQIVDQIEPLDVIRRVRVWDGVP